MIDISVETLNNRIIDQLKTEFAIINAEKRRIYLWHLLTQTKIERKIEFSVASVTKIETKRIRSDFEQQATLSLKKRLKFKISIIYFENIQKFFDKYIWKFFNEFDFKSIIYQIDITKILFASKYLFHAIFNDWHKHRRNVDINTYI